jgi:lambda repressor-like predicted transcriptional regulator
MAKMKNMKTMKTMKTMKNKTLSNKCSQSFCEKKVLKMSKKKDAKVFKETRKMYMNRQKEFKDKIAAAKKNGNKEELEKLTKENAYNNSILKSYNNKKISKLMDKLLIEFCENSFCNPTCKNSMFESKMKSAFYDKLPADFVADLKKNGATSACILQKPPEPFY